LWENFFAAMHSDIERPRLKTFEEFLDYTEGASVAPTTIYLCLIAASADAGAESPRYRLPEGFDLIACGRALGTFAYLGHILRDMAEDLATGEEGLVYLAAEDMRLHDVDEALMRRDLARTEASPALRALVRDLGQRAEEFLATGRQLCLPLADQLQPDCAYILELIVTIYEEVLAKIASHGHDPMTEQHRLSMDEKLTIAAAVSERTGFSPED
jgi:phytoene/squalene synthetase